MIKRSKLQIFFYTGENQKPLFCMILSQSKNSTTFQWTIPQREPAHTCNIPNFRTKRQFSQIKQHQKTYTYTNSRSYLIENTKRVIKPNKHETKDINPKEQATVQLWSGLLKGRKIAPQNQNDLTHRQSRRAAISNFRKKIWKSNDAGSLVKFQQEKLSLSKNDFDHSKNSQNQQKIRRYKETIPIKIKQFEFSQQKIKRQWLQRTYPRSKVISRKNPQISHVKTLDETAEDRQSIVKEQVNLNLTMHDYYSLIQDENRPNTTGATHSKVRSTYSKMELEPW